MNASERNAIKNMVNHRYQTITMALRSAGTRAEKENPQLQIPSAVLGHSYAPLERAPENWIATLPKALRKQAEAAIGKLTEIRAAIIEENKRREEIARLAREAKFGLVNELCNERDSLLVELLTNTLSEEAQAFLGKLPTVTNMSDRLKRLAIDGSELERHLLAANAA